MSNVTTTIHIDPVKCSARNCNKPAHCKGYCTIHYSRWRRHGDPEGGIERGIGRRLALEALCSDTDECIPWPLAKNHKGYGSIVVDGKKFVAHRWIAIQVHGPAPTDKPEAAHSCGNSWCTNPRHIRWASAKENSADRKMHGTQCRGSHVYGARLTEKAVRAIRADLRAGKPQPEIASHYGVSRATVSSIATRRSWAWLI